MIKMPSFFLIFCFFISSGINLSHQSSGNWGYFEVNGPKTWPELCQTGKKQSPIDIVTDNTIKADLGSLKFIRYDFAYYGTLSNTGHSVQIELSGVPVHLSGGSLPSTYVLEQLHFHWEAEHTVDGIRDALELHLVHYDKKYENVSTASHYPGGVCVVAVLFKMSDHDNEEMQRIIMETLVVTEWVGKSSVKMKHKVVPILLLPEDQTSYYRYDGSLTTPGCQESVTWIVMTEKLPISMSQLSVFKQIKTQNGTLTQNYRSTQNLNNRKVYHHLLGYTSTASQFSPSNLIYMPIATVALPYLLIDF